MNVFREEEVHLEYLENTQQTQSSRRERKGSRDEKGVSGSGQEKRKHSPMTVGHHTDLSQQPRLTPPAFLEGPRAILSIP